MFLLSFILNRWLILGCIYLHLRNTNTVKLQCLCSEPARHSLTQPQVLSLCCSVFISQGERWPALPCCVHGKKKKNASCLLLLRHLFLSTCVKFCRNMFVPARLCTHACTNKLLLAKFGSRPPSELLLQPLSPLWEFISSVVLFRVRRSCAAFCSPSWRKVREHM